MEGSVNALDLESVEAERTPPPDKRIGWFDDSQESPRSSPREAGYDRNPPLQL